MKPFLGIDVTEKSDETKINGEEFLVSSAPAALPKVEEEPIPESEPEITEEKADGKKAKKKKPEVVHYIPVYLRVIRFICGALSIAGLAVLCRIYFGISGRSYVSYYYQKMPWLFYIGGACIFIWFALNAVEGILESRANKLAQTDDGSTVFDENANLTMNVPEDAAHADLLVFNYKTENDGISAVYVDDALSPYSNYDVRIFADNDNLYLATFEEKYAFPISSLLGIREVKEPIAVPDWNKEVPPTKGEYKQYGMSVDNLNRVTLPRYYILELENSGEKWGIYFPCYELNTFEALTGLEAK